MADAADSKSVGRKPVKVRLLSPAPSLRDKHTFKAFALRQKKKQIPRTLFNARKLLMSMTFRAKSALVMTAGLNLW
jgi:hypothetical protein